MKRSRFNGERVISILKEQEAGLGTTDPCCKHGISSDNFYDWKAKYSGPEVSADRRLKALAEENSREKLLTVAMLDNANPEGCRCEKCITCPARAKIDFDLAMAVRLKVSGLSRVDRCCGQATMGSAPRVPRK